MLDSHFCFMASFVYGMNDDMECIPLWEDLSNFSQTVQAQPWIVTGDFNSVRHISKKSGRNLSWTTAMEAFNKCCAAADIDDLKFVGHLLTWSNKNPNNPISKKLDRALINSSWLSAFPNAEAEFLSPGISDHCHIIIRLGISFQRLNKPFKFFNFLADHPSFEGLVEDAWDTSIPGSPLYQFCRKLKSLKAQLEILNQESFSKLPFRLSAARESLYAVQNQLNAQPQCPILRQREKAALEKFVVISKAEEELFHQKSRVKWIELGDQNTSYFHKAVKQRFNRNKIISLSREDGTCLRGHSLIATEVVHHFKKI